MVRVNHLCIVWCVPCFSSSCTLSR